MAHPTGRPGDESVTTTRAGENLVDPQRSFYRYVMPFVVSLLQQIINILASNYTANIIAATDSRFYLSSFQMG
jgi:hypothetical protein